MSWLSKIFGGKAEGSDPSQVEEYQGFRIIPELMPEDRAFRLAARVEKDVDGETKVHHVIRADTIEGKEAVIAASIAKAKQMIDEQGDSLFR